MSVWIQKDIEGMRATMTRREDGLQNSGSPRFIYFHFLPFCIHRRLRRRRRQRSQVMCLCVGAVTNGNEKGDKNNENNKNNSESRGGDGE